METTIYYNRGYVGVIWCSTTSAWLKFQLEQSECTAAAPPEVLPGMAIDESGLPLRNSS